MRKGTIKMNVLFLTMNVFTDIEMHNIYSDLMKEFINHGFRPYIVTPREKKLGEKTELINYSSYSLLKVRIGNTSNVSLVEKGISTITFGSQFYNAVRDNLGGTDFELILYSTPPITLATPVNKLKKLFKCRTYLMLKDIFPQNAVDLEMFSRNSLIYKFFRIQEKKLYKLSDKIGCMSPANVDYVIRENPEIDKTKVEVCPNAIIPHEIEDNSIYKKMLRERFSIPANSIVYLYGGNLGKPQGIEFLIQCLKSQVNLDKAYFIICGSGSEYHLLEKFIEEENPSNIKLISFLPKEEYDQLVKGCDVGMIFLDYRFTIPNFPSRVLSYMENSMPVLVCTDSSSDMGDICEDNALGLKCLSNSVDSFKKCLDTFRTLDIKKMGKNARTFLENNYCAEKSYEVIMRR